MSSYSARSTPIPCAPAKWQNSTETLEAGGSIYDDQSQIPDRITALITKEWPTSTISVREMDVCHRSLSQDKRHRWIRSTFINKDLKPYWSFTLLVDGMKHRIYSDAEGSFAACATLALAQHLSKGTPF